MLRSYDKYIFIILRGSPDKRNTADINLLYNLFLGSSSCHRLFKGIKIHDNQINGGDIVGLDLFFISVVIAPVKNSSKNLRMEGLYSSPQDRWITTHLFHCFALVS